MNSLFPEAGAVISKVLIEDGLTKEIVKVGEGINPKEGEEVYAHYTGKLTSNGKEFDSSRSRGKPFVFRIGIGQVISAWDKGIQTMQPGERAIITCDAAHGYGGAGAGGVIPPNASLAFDVELISAGAAPESGWCVIA